MKKFFSVILLALVLCVNAVSIAFAEDGTETVSTQTENDNGGQSEISETLFAKRITAQVGKEYTVALYVENSIKATEQYKISYDSEKLVLLPETIQHLNKNQDVNIVSNQSGSLLLDVTKTVPSGKVWGGACVLLKFKAVSAGVTAVCIGEFAVASEFWDGYGTATNPYLIRTVDDLTALSNQVNSGVSYQNMHFKLTNNIALSGSWVPIGGRCGQTSGYIPNGNYFAGYFDGNNKTISGMNVNQVTGDTSYGLFGYVNGGGIYNLTVNGAVTLTSDSTIEYVGGIVGYTNSSVYNCHTNVTINVSNGSNVGGIAGAIENTDTGSSVKKIQYCSAVGNIIAYKRIGGVVGGVYCNANGGIEVDNCSYKNGNIACQSVGGKPYCGGIVGYCRGYISNCYAKDITFTNSCYYQGGIVGIMQGVDPMASMYNCYTKISFAGNTSANNYCIAGSADRSAVLPFVNCYWQETGNGISQAVSPNWGYWTNQTASTAEQMMNGTVANALGAAFEAVPNDYPRLAWESDGYYTVAAGTETENVISLLGSGSENDPYQILCEADLIKLSAWVNKGESFSGKYFKLMNNVSLTNAWVPIGGRCGQTSGYIPNGNYFAGYFDGNNKTISGMNVNQVTGDTSYGLFGYVNGGGIYNLTVNGAVTLTSDSTIEYVGGIVGYTNSSVYNCHTNVTINVPNGSNVGGIAGAIENTDTGSSVKKIQYCSAVGNITAYKRIGGVVGGVYCNANGGIRIDNCTYKNGTICSSGTGGKIYCGGIVSYCRGYISNCYVKDITFANNTYCQGGIAGILQKSDPAASMYNCYSKVNFAESSTSYNYCIVGSADRSPAVPFINCYWQVAANGTSQNVDSLFGYWTNQTASTAEQMTNGTVANALGAAFEAVPNNYPRLTWEATGYYTIFSGTETGNNLPGGPYNAQH